MITKSRYNRECGQEEEYEYQMNSAISYGFGGNVVVVYDKDQNTPAMKLLLASGVLQYQRYDAETGNWLPAQTITPPATDPSDSDTLPLNAGNNYAQVNHLGFQVVLAATQRLFLD